ncbi:MAG: nucleoside deaminase [Pseudomonadota bacterium]
MTNAHDTSGPLSAGDERNRMTPSGTITPRRQSMTNAHDTSGPLSAVDERNLKAAMDSARAAILAGEGPFGAVVAGPEGTIVMTQHNETLTARDHTRHAEAVLASRFCRAYYDQPEFRAGSTLYSSMEPCAMCMFTMFKAGIGRLVYGLSAERMYSAHATFATLPRTTITSRECAQRMNRPMLVLGPYFEDEGLQLWDEAFRRFTERRG